MHVLCVYAEECREKGIDCGHAEPHAEAMDCHRMSACWAGKVRQCIPLLDWDMMSSPGRVKELDFEE